MNLWSGIFRVSLVLFAALVVAFVAYVFYHPIRRFNELKGQEQKLDQEIRVKEETVEYIRTKRNRLATDPRFVERIARDQLGLSKPGEVIYRVPDSEGGSP